MSDDAEPAGLERPKRWIRWAVWSGDIAAYAVVGLGLAGLLLGMSHASYNPIPLILGGALFGTGGLIALVRGPASRRGRVHLAVVGGCIVVLIGSYFTRAPLQLRFRLSEAAFQQWIADQPAVHSDITTPFRLGLYDIDSVVASSDGYMFYDRAENLADTGNGIAYLPNGTVGAFAGYKQDVFVHLDGPWYSWVGYS
jgi:hypothetical protein